HMPPSSHTDIYTLSLHDALPISVKNRQYLIFIEQVSLFFHVGGVIRLLHKSDFLAPSIFYQPFVGIPTTVVVQIQFNEHITVSVRWFYPISSQLLHYIITSISSVTLSFPLHILLYIFCLQGIL